MAQFSSREDAEAALAPGIDPRGRIDAWRYLRNNNLLYSSAPQLPPPTGYGIYIRGRGTGGGIGAQGAQGPAGPAGPPGPPGAGGWTRFALYGPGQIGTVTLGAVSTQVAPGLAISIAEQPPGGRYVLEGTARVLFTGAGTSGIVGIDVILNGLSAGTLNFSSSDSDPTPFIFWRLVVDDDGTGNALVSSLTMIKAGESPTVPQTSVIIPSAAPQPNYFAQVFAGVAGDPCDFTMVSYNGVTYTP
jgi:hypothetical protein